MSTTEPTADLAPALAALEAAAAALLAGLAARGVPADELPEAVVLALAAQQERIGLLSAFCHSLHDRLERLEEMIRRSGDIPAEGYQRRTARLQAEAALATPRYIGTPNRAFTIAETAQFRAALASGQASGLVGLPINLRVDLPAPPPAVPPEVPPPVRASLIDLDSAPDAEARDALMREIASRAGVPAPIGRWHVSYVTDPAPLSRIDARVRVRGGAGRWYIFPVFEDGEVGRAMLEPGQESSAPPEAPRFRHDCPDCTFLGRSVCGTQDLYYCEVDWMPRHVSVRWGNVDDDSNKERFVTRSGIGGFVESGDWPDLHLAEAYRRAVAAGLVGEGEGPISDEPEPEYRPCSCGSPFGCAGCGGRGYLEDEPESGGTPCGK